MILDFIQTKAWSSPAPTAPIMWWAGTTTVASITDTTALLWGTYTDGWSPITANWFVIYPNGNPSTVIWWANVIQVVDWTLSSPLSETAVNLAGGTNYCFKPYAINAIGTSYGTEVCFTTLNSPFVYTWNLIGWTTSKINTTTNTVVATITNSAWQPHWALRFWDFVYVSLNVGMALDKINTITNTVVASLPLWGQGKYLATDWTVLIVCVSSTNQIKIIDIATFTVLFTVSVWASPYQVAINNWFAYVTNNGWWTGNTLSKVNISTWTVVGTVALTWQTWPNGIVIYNGFAYVACSNSNSVAVVNLATDTFLTSVSVWTLPYGIWQSQWFIYCTNQSSNNISKINTATNTVVWKIALWAGTQPLAFQSNGNRWFIACFWTSQCKILDTTTDTIIATVAVWSWPFAVAI